MLAALILGCSTPEPPAPAPAPEAPVTGSASCEPCHAEVFAAWRASHHALAERELGPDDTWARELGAVRLIGVEPVVQGLIPADGGRLQAHQEAWDPRDGTRFDIFGDGRQPGEWGHWTGGGMTWNGRCAACHTTFLAKRYDGTDYSTTYAELGVGCEACHGEASAHAQGGPPPENTRMDDTCASCHSRRAELTGAFRPGDAYLDHFAPSMLEDPRVFAADGRAIDEAFEWNQLVSSPMYTGGARCGDCHDPHSGRVLAEGNALCDRCHEKLGTATHGPSRPLADPARPFGTATHGPSRPLADPARPFGTATHGTGPCVDCHMPTNRLMARHDRRDHGFTRPDDDRFSGFERARTGGGIEGLALDVPDRGRRASHVAALGRYPDDPAAREALRHALSDADPLVRASAASALAPADPEDLRVLELAASDPVRAVRVGAQRSLVQAGWPVSRAADYRAYLDHNADDPSTRAEKGLIRVRSGDPRGLDDLAAATRLDPGNPDLVVLRAIGLSTAGREATAITELRAALDAHPDHVELRATLGLALAATDPAGAITSLEQVVAAEPDRFRAWRNLALLYAGQGRTDDAKHAAERALGIDPRDTELATWAAGL
ncbi:MAG: cytochrome c3 family protein [Myxococcota bacterium]